MRRAQRDPRRPRSSSTWRSKWETETWPASSFMIATADDTVTMSPNTQRQRDSEREIGRQTRHRVGNLDVVESSHTLHVHSDITTPRPVVDRFETTSWYSERCLLRHAMVRVSRQKKKQQCTCMATANRPTDCIAKIH